MVLTEDSSNDASLSVQIFSDVFYSVFVVGHVSESNLGLFHVKSPPDGGPTESSEFFFEIRNTF